MEYPKNSVQPFTKKPYTAPKLTRHGNFAKVVKKGHKTGETALNSRT